MMKRSITIRGKKGSATRRFYVYRVSIEPDEGRYHAEIPALPGCYSWGITYEDALKNIKEAAELWLEAMAEDGELIPKKICRY